MPRCLTNTLSLRLGNEVPGSDGVAQGVQARKVPHGEALARVRRMRSNAARLLEQQEDVAVLAFRRALTRCKRQVSVAQRTRLSARARRDDKLVVNAPAPCTPQPHRRGGCRHLCAAAHGREPAGQAGLQQLVRLFSRTKPRTWDVCDHVVQPAAELGVVGRRRVWVHHEQREGRL